MKKEAPKAIQSIGDLIPALLRKLGLERGVKEHEILERWAEIVGPKIAEVSSAERIRDGKLWVVVGHPAWRNELNFYKEELNILEHRLGEIISRNTINEVEAGVESFQNRFDLQRDHINSLKNTIKKHEHALADYAKDKPIVVDRVHFKDHSSSQWLPLRD